MSGKVVYSEQKNVNPTSYNKFSINKLLNIAQGVYFIKLITNTKVFKHKIIKK